MATSVDADKAVALFAERVLPMYLPDLAEEAERLAIGSIDEFSDTMAAAITGILFDARNVFGVNNLDELGAEANAKIRGYMVASLNEVLPAEHPYLIALAYAKDERVWHYMPLFRDKHPETREMLRTRVVPVVLADTLREPLENIKIEILDDSKVPAKFN